MSSNLLFVCLAVIVMGHNVNAEALTNKTQKETVFQCTHLYPAGTHKVELDGRYFLLLVPNRLSTIQVAPIVYDVPGFSESPYYQKELTGIMDFLEDYGWIGAIPFGTAPSETSTCCPSTASQSDCEKGITLDKSNPCSFNAGGCCGVAATRQINDVEFARNVIKFIEKNMCGDTQNVFATGFSNGGMMSNRLGCDASDLFKAVAPVAGNVRLGGDLSACRPNSAIGWLSLCGSIDSACNRDFDSSARDWAVRNGCRTDVDPSPTYTTATTKCFKYEGCRAPVEFCTLVDLDHEWPGRNRPDGTSPSQPSTNVDATTFIFDRWMSMVDPNHVSQMEM